jgi:hypothetical protein
MSISFFLCVMLCAFAAGFLFLFGVLTVIARTTVYVD